MIANQKMNLYYDANYPYHLHKRGYTNPAENVSLMWKYQAWHGHSIWLCDNEDCLISVEEALMALRVELGYSVNKEPFNGNVDKT